MIESEFAAKAAQAHALLGELAAAVSADTSGVLATEVLPEVFGAVRQVELLTCRLIERADRSGAFKVDGAASTTQYVKKVSGESGAWASKRVKLGRALADRMPMTGKAWGAGDLGIDHAQVIANTIREQDYDLALDMEGFLAEHAAGLTVEELKTVAAELLAAAAPETADDEAARKRAAQHLSFSETLDGMWRLDGWLDPEAGLIVSNAIASFTRKPDPDGDVLTESAPHRRAEALVQMAKHATAHAEDCNGQGGNRSTIIVGHQPSSLTRRARHSRNPGRQTPSRRSSPADGVRRRDHPRRLRLRLPDPRLRPADPHPPRPGYAATSSPETAAASFPAAIGHPAWCQVHHGDHWGRGGHTKACKLHLLCEHHHHKVHEGGWEITIGNDKDRTPWFHPPDGRPPLKGQRRPLFRPATDTPRRT